MIKPPTMEILDVVDKNDEVIGVASKKDIYSKELCHRIVHVLIFNDEGKMALQLRSNRVNFCPNHWSTAVGGHVETNESYYDAALREYEEELGTVSEIEELSKDFYDVEGIPSKFLVTYTSTFNGPFNPDKRVVDEVGFFTIQEMRAMLNAGEKFHPELLFLLEKYYL